MKELDIKIPNVEKVNNKQNNTSKPLQKPKEKFLVHKLQLMDKHSLHRTTLARVLNSNLEKDVKLPKGLKKVSSIVDDFYNKNEWQEKLYKSAINDNWEKIMGKLLAPKTKPSWTKDGKLIIICFLPDLAFELEHNINVIYNKIKKITNIPLEISVSVPTKL